ncbi:4-coumarate- ligase [Colletotrichum karsti]|uniref:4-coumarate- ligase n=1 Tax=Colletotrichum karsti TaxID=1095194 RepID=A0A9P6HZ68_9PEZI|nr:4-coumarate- ligase [Colletotrichum karsti]KAF9874298.1 4-coumarate- ligase [Colletotrichum karsti]
MPFSGAPFDPVPQHLTIWEWLFEDHRRDVRTNAFTDALSTERVTFETLKTYATSASISLALDHALKAKEKVAIVCRSSVWYPVAVFAAIRLGAVVVPLPHEAKPPDYEYFLKTCGAKLVFVDESTVDLVRPACARLNLGPESIMSVDGSVKGLKSLQTLIGDGGSLGRQEEVSYWQLSSTQTNDKTCAYLAFSSGTTGLPKAVMISHANVISQCLQMQIMELGTGVPLLAPLPFYHITGLAQFLHLPILFDQETILLSKFNMEAMMSAITRYKCGELWLVPPILIRMVNENVAQKYDLSCVKQFNTGAAPLSPQVIEKLSKDFPNVRLRQGWGMTESCSCITTTPKDLQTYENAHKIWARGPQVTMGYLNNEKATRDTFDQDGYLHTGDLGMMGRDGFITIHDRIKEMIKVKGHGVAPAELEDTLHGHAKVADVAVIGIPDEYSGEVPKAFVVLKPDVSKSQETIEELQKHVEEAKARYMWLRGGIEFIDEIPKSASGKILRRALRESEKKKAAQRGGKARL